MNKNRIFEAIEEIYKTIDIKDDIIKFIEHKAHEKLLVYSSLEKVYVDEMIEDGRYEEVIDKLKSVIEELEGGYCVILDKIEKI